MDLILTQGKVALLDDRDWLIGELFSWYAVSERGRWYAAAHRPGGQGTHCKLKLHRVVADATEGEMVDHVNGNGLDNRRANLRLCTNALNQQNAGGRGGSSRYKGVSWVAGRGQWRVAFNFAGRTHFVGYYADEREAASAYNLAAAPLAGAAARLNDLN